MGDDELAQIVDSAHDAFDDWRKRPLKERAGIVAKVGELMLDRAFQVAKPGGRVVSIKGDAPDGLGEADDVDFDYFFMSQNGDQFAQIAALIEAGTVHPIVDSEFPLVDVAKAYQRARSEDANRKVIVAMR